MARREYVISRIGRIRSVANEFIEEQLKANGLTGMVASHGAILDVLFRNHGELSMKDIAAKIGKTKSTVTELIRKLETAGYVEKRKDAGDERVTLIVLTEKSHSVRERLYKISADLIEKCYAGFSEEEKETLNCLLDKMERNFKAD